MTAQDRLLNNLLKAVEEYNKEHKNNITPLEVLKIFLNMNK